MILRGPGSDPDPRAAVARFMRRLWRRGLTTSLGGNVSVRDAAGSVWITPAGCDKARLQAGDVVAVRGDGVSGAASSELPLHRHLYDARPDVGAVVHAHAPGIVAFAIRGQAPDVSSLAWAGRTCGRVRLAANAPTGSDDLGRRAVEALGCDGRCAILERHAAVAVGRTLPETFVRFEALERAARILIAAAGLPADPPAHRCPSVPGVVFGDRTVVSEDTVRRELCALARRAGVRGLAGGADGRFSARLADGRLLMTLPDTDPEDVDAHTVQSRRTADAQDDPTEALHAAIYAACREVGAVVSAAPVSASALALAGVPLWSAATAESAMVLGDLPLLPGDDFRQAAAAVGPTRPAALVPAHGAVVVAATAQEAFTRLEALEAAARAQISQPPL